MFELPVMKIDETSSKEEIRKLKSYIYQLTEQLRYTLNNISADNMTEQVREILNESSKAGIRIRELTDQEQQEFENIRKKIVSTAQDIAKAYAAEILKSENSIKTLVSEMYVAKSEGSEEGSVAELKDFIASYVNQIANKIELRFVEIQETTQTTKDQVDKNKEEIEKNKLELETYIRFSMEGMEIGKLVDGNTSPFSLLISNEKISFRSYLTEVAYIMYDKLYITDVHVTNKLILGKTDRGFFEFIPRTSGNLSLKWRSE